MIKPKAVQGSSPVEDARMVFTIYTNLTTSKFPKRKATFGCGATWKDLIADGLCFNAAAMLLLTFLETGSLTKKDLANLALIIGSEIATYMQ